MSTLFGLACTLGVLIVLAVVLAERRDRGCLVAAAVLAWAVVGGAIVVLGWITESMGWFTR